MACHEINGPAHNHDDHLKINFGQTLNHRTTIPQVPTHLHINGPIQNRTQKLQLSREQPKPKFRLPSNQLQLQFNSISSSSPSLH
jgi:hypothetical protein